VNVPAPDLRPGSATDAQPLPASGTVIAFASAAQALIAVCTAALPALAPMVARALGVDASLIGYQASIVYGCAMCSTFATGTLIRRLGATRTIQISMAMSALGLAMVSAATVPAIVAGSISIGLALGITTPSTAHWLARFTPIDRQNVVFSLKQAGVPLGGIFAAIIGPLVAVTAGWQAALLLFAAFCATLAIALQPRRARWDDDRDPAAPWLHQPFGGIPTVWNDPPVRLLVLAGASFNVMHVALTAFTVNLLVKDLGYSLVAAGIISGLAQLGGAVGRVSLGFVADRLPDSLTVMTAAGAAMTAMCLLTGLMSERWPDAAVVIVFIAFGFIGIGWNGVYHGQLARLSRPGKVGLTSSGAGFFLFLTALAGPSLFAVLYAWAGSYTLTFALLASTPLAGMLLALIAQRRVRADPARAAGTPHASARPSAPPRH
jgi:predicted MFS family arabinose efflux permease